ncbi:MAG: hypothetical protein K0Q81_426 [Paenibacillus sp.]|nr:hypothetical protein [Paenibacillus sp.]
MDREGGNLMSSQLIANKEISIQALAANVWEVLVKPDFIKQWDDVPEDYKETDLRLGSEFVWKSQSNATKLTVIAFVPYRLLQMALHLTSWTVKLAPENIAYTYRLTDQGSSTLLSIEVGDFAKLPDGQPYYEASLEFVETAALKIKQLAEQLYRERVTPKG